jgi:hypothetical protein
MTLDDRRALGVLQDVGDRGLLDVEDLASDRQQRLVIRGTRQLGGAEGAVALDDEQLGPQHVVGAAVSEFGRQGGRLQGGLATLGLLVLARTDPRLHLETTFSNNSAA